MPANPSALLELAGSKAYKPEERAAISMLLKAGPRTSTVDDGMDPTRDPIAMARCPHVGSGCPKLRGEPCGMAEGCPLGMGKGLSHQQQVEVRRRQEAMAKGLSELAWNRKRAATAAAWKALEGRVRAVAPQERPMFRPGELSRSVEDAMPGSVKALIIARPGLPTDSVLDA